MVNLLEVCRRAHTGPTIDEQSFQLEVVYQTAKRLCDKYNIVYDRENPVPADDDLADRLYQAGIDFVCEAGAYCSDTNRMIKFTREEALEAITHSRAECVLGEGKDRFVFRSRKPESDIRPWFHVGTGIMSTDERMHFSLVSGYASIQQANSISTPALEKIDGQFVASGTPTEVYGAIRAIRIARDALRHAGRPGLAIGNCISTCGTVVGTIAAGAPQFGLRPCDGWLVPMYTELKVDLATLSKTAYLLNWGANICVETGPMVAGYAGGPAETAVILVGYLFAGLLVFSTDYHLLFPGHLHKGCSTAREVLWAIATSAQAISRNTSRPVLYLGYAAAGPMTKQYYYETAAYVAAAIPSGGSIWTNHPARGLLNDYMTPMEARGTVELAEGCIGMKRTEANAIVKELLKKYEDRFGDAPIGKKYQECYDINSGKPSQEYADLYGEVIEEIRSMGIKVPAPEG